MGNIGSGKLKPKEKKYFTYLYDEYKNYMYGLALSILKNPQIAEDAVQTAFTKLLPKYAILSTLSKPQEKA